jgi:integrase
MTPLKKQRAAAFDTPPKRNRLVPRRNPYWQGISGGRGGVSLGYRRAVRGPGTWVAKIVINGKRMEERIGLADDDGATADALGYSQAVREALDWAERCRNGVAARSEDTATSDPTVEMAVRDYVAARMKRSGRSGRDAESRLQRHVLSDRQFAATKLSRLTAADVRAWRLRLGAGQVVGRKAQASSSNPRRLADSSVNRLLNDLRAALNGAAETHRRALPAHVMAEIKIGTRAEADASVARQQILHEAEVRAIVDAAQTVDPDGDFGRLVLLLAATGARFSQIARLTVSDVQPAKLRIMVPAAAKGRVVRQKPKIAVPVGPDVINALAAVLERRKGQEILLERWRSRQVGPAAWERISRGPWSSAAEMTRPWAAARKLAGIPDAIPYALRHSSIVKGLQKGVPTRVVAAVHDTSSSMIEKHYASFILDATEEIVRRAIVPLVDNSAAPLLVVGTGSNQ